MIAQTHDVNDAKAATTSFAAPDPANDVPSVSRREWFLLLALGCGTFIAVTTELLSAFNLLSFGWLAASWAIALFIAAAILARSFKTGWTLTVPCSRADRSAACLSLGLIVIALLTAATALLAAPNNYDAMAYHMSRVAHWTQNRNVAFYPTHILTQLVFGPWTEFAILHLQILSSGDRFANVVQWFCMIGCVIGASLLTKRLGGKGWSQLFAAVFTATLPMGILQASSADNHYAVSFWLLAFVYFGLSLILNEQNRRRYVLGAGLSLGLAVLTKGTAYIFAAPFAIWIAYALLKRSPARSWRALLAISAVGLALNFGPYARNFNLFGSPIGPLGGNYLGRLTNEVFEPAAIVSNVVRNVALHLGTPSQLVNAVVNRAIREFHRILRVDVDDPRTTWKGARFLILPPSLGELAGNPLHVFLLFAATLLFFASKAMRSERAPTAYLAALASGFLLFCLLLKWQPWNSRLNFPLFVLAAPFVAVVLAKRLAERLVFGLALVLLLSATPWLLFSAQRPLLGRNSIIGHHSRTDQYFIRWPALREVYFRIADLIKTNKCRRIGLELGAHDLEYPFWALLKTDTNEPIRIEHVHVENPSGALSAAPPFNDFVPCAIVSSVNRRLERAAAEKGTYVHAWASKDIVVSFDPP